MNTRRTLAAAGAAALLLAACADEEPVDGDDPNVESEDDADDGSDDGSESEDDSGEALAGDALEDLDLDDPNELVANGRFTGNGMVLPTPEGWELDPMAFASGVVLATGPDGMEQIAGEAVDPAELDQSLSFDEVLEANRTSVQQEPEIDEEVELPGAVRAQHLRFLDVPNPQAAEGEDDAPGTSVVLLVAEREDGVLGVFNYAASADDFDDAIAEQLLATAGFDPDSDPVMPEPAPQPQPQPEG